MLSSLMGARPAAGGGTGGLRKKKNFTDNSAAQSSPTSPTSPLDAAPTLRKKATTIEPSTSPIPPPPPASEKPTTTSRAVTDPDRGTAGDDSKVDKDDSHVPPPSASSFPDDATLFAPSSGEISPYPSSDSSSPNKKAHPDIPRLTIHISSSPAPSGPSSATSIREEVERAFQRTLTLKQSKKRSNPPPPPSPVRNSKTLPQPPSYLRPPRRPSVVTPSSSPSSFATHARRPSGIPRSQVMQAVTVKKRVIGGPKKDAATSSSTSVSSSSPATIGGSTSHKKSAAKSAGARRSASSGNEPEPDPAKTKAALDAIVEDIFGDLAGGEATEFAATPLYVAPKPSQGRSLSFASTRRAQTPTAAQSIRVSTRGSFSIPTSPMTPKGKQQETGSAAKLRLPASSATPKTRSGPDVPSTRNKRDSAGNHRTSKQPTTKGPSKNKFAGAVNKMVSSTATLLGFLIRGSAPRKSITAGSAGVPQGFGAGRNSGSSFAYDEPPAMRRKSEVPDSPTSARRSIPANARVNPPFAARPSSRLSSGATRPASRLSSGASGSAAARPLSRLSAGVSGLAKGSLAKNLPPSRPMTPVRPDQRPGAASRPANRTVAALLPNKNSVKRSGSFSSTASTLRAQSPAPGTSEAARSSTPQPSKLRPAKKNRSSVVPPVPPIPTAFASNREASTRGGPALPLNLDFYGFLKPTPGVFEVGKTPLTAATAPATPAARRQALVEATRAPRWRELATEQLVGESVRLAAGLVEPGKVSSDAASEKSEVTEGTTAELGGVPLRVMVDPVYSFSHTSEKFRTRLVREGVPQLWRGHVWYHLLTHQSGLCKSTADHDVLDSELISELSKLRSSESKHDKLIIRDVDEAFPNHVLFLDTPAPDGESSPTASKGKAGLKALLLAFSQGERKFGYWRGLSKIAAVLLLLMEEERAYVALAHMFHAPPTPQPPVGNAIPRPIYNLRSLIATGDASVDAEFLFIHEELMRLWTPKLFARWIQQNSVPSESYLFAWINSMFVEAVSPVDLRSAGAERVDEDRSFIPFRVLVRVWDLVMLWGVDLLFVVAVALLKKHEAFLLSLPPSSAAYFLLPPPPTMDDSSESSIASPPLIHTVRAVWTSNPSLPATTGSSSSSSSLAPAAGPNDLDEAFIKSIVALWTEIVTYPSKPVGGATSGKKLSGRGVVARVREVFHKGTV